ncbi:UvrD-helicase domain-containing protein [Stenotrophomonas sp. C1657]|uniref:UvrD-helicase domain-containing protein n=1 Tax=Stenotrophomonas sp. C1657 TaxID=3077844 RepID=UPI00293CA1D3|nr:UvrD-helicase domain-containing protein [Stenotrophomonas sp. C1657]MDV3514696.1 UvrD-helicase domain-containing protein [Stenotrophomonas sp. C1657]
MSSLIQGWEWVCSSAVKLLASLIRDHIEDANDHAFEEGRRRGLAEGRTEGYSEGLQKGQLVYKVEEAPAKPSKALDPGLYGPARFAVATVESQMRNEVALAVAAGIVRAPTEEQWRMILSDHPATCISAGAGSGKSTTLVLRVVFMLQHLGVRDEELTVISFTRASCHDLRQSLRKVLGFWRGSEISEKWANRRVRTFHSVLCGLAETSLPGRKLFTFLGDKEDPILEAGEEDVDNPITGSKLNDAQAAVIRKAYGSLFSQSQEFRSSILAIVRSQLAVAALDRSGGDLKPGRIYYAAMRDNAVREMLERLWESHGWPFEGVEVGPFEIPASLGQHKLYASGVEKATNTPVVLGFPPSSDESVRMLPVIVKDIGDYSLGKAQWDKKTILSRYAERPYIFIQSESDLKNFLLRQKVLKESSEHCLPADAPVFPVRLDGEMKEALIYEALFSQGEFIETLGIEVTQMINRMPTPQVIDVNTHFLSALGLFWPHLRKEMEQQKLHTYNQAFLTLTGVADTVRLNAQRLGALRHLLVDEFQDISPQIASWLKAMQRRLLSDNPSKPVSVMAIGDDWQSIYGWRGSAPQLFIKFVDYFRTHEALGPAGELMLTANFRSVPAVLADAERLIDRVGIKVAKRCDPKVPQLSGDHGVRLEQYSNKEGKMSREDELRLLSSEISSIYKSALAMKLKSTEKVIVMTRSGDMRDKLRSAFPQRRYPGMTICTYHQAKGLEADVAVMVGDCAPGASYPIRNMLYAASGMYPSYTYDDASADEAFRLAYVGVTRARRRVFWYVKRAGDGGTAVVYASAT